MSIGVFDVATSGDDESRIRKQADTDRVAAAIYDVRQRFGSYLFSAADSDGFDDRAKLSYVDICKAIEPHVHARKGVHSRVMKALKNEWRSRQASPGLAPAAGGQVSPGEPAGGIIPPGNSLNTPGNTAQIPAPGKVDIAQQMTSHRRTACWPGCHENEAHAKKFHKDKKDSDEKEARRTAAEDGAFERSAPDHPEQHIQETYHPHDGEKLIPEGNWDSYKDRVDQGGPEKVESHAFIPGEHDKHFTADEGRNFVSYNQIARLMQGVAPMTAPAGAPPAPAAGAAGSGTSEPLNPAAAAPMAPGTGDSSAGGSSAPTQAPIQPMAARSHIARMMQAERGQRWATAAILEGGVADARERLLKVCHQQGVVNTKQARALYSMYKTADKDYLRQADEALTKVLNEQAEQFQQTIAPLQQALITVQQAQQLQNPLNVAAPAGTVNVMPGQQGGGGAPPPQGQDPTGMTADPAAAQLAGQQPAASAMQQTAKRGGRGKA